MTNLLIAMLANTHSMLDGTSKGLFLVKIIASRGKFRNDAAYGAFLGVGGMPPLCLITIP